MSLYEEISYQLKLIKMHAKLANLNHRTVPFLSRAVVKLSWCDSAISIIIYLIMCTMASFKDIFKGGHVCTIPNCKKCYTGRSVRALRVRIGEHRRAVDPENYDFPLAYIFVMM